jgi:putative intracellular protease/amidase
MLTKVLIVLTSHSQLGDTGKLTGYYLPEVSHPYFELKKAGLEVEFASIAGGKAPMDESSRDLTDPINKKFLEDKKLVSMIENTKALSKVNAKDYAVIMFAGGHGTMWDFADSQAVQNISAKIYESGGVVAALCHGPAALVNIKLTNGQYLVAGKEVTGFSNAEEEAAKLTKIMPFLLETKLIERGARYSKAGLWQENVVVSERLVTGQNPASATKLAKEVIKLVQAK